MIDKLFKVVVIAVFSLFILSLMPVILALMFQIPAVVLGKLVYDGVDIRPMLEFAKILGVAVGLIVGMVLSYYMASEVWDN